MESTEGSGWLICPDGVERHVVFGSRGEPSAEERYLTWVVNVHTITTVISTEESSPRILDVHHRVERQRVSLRRLLGLYGSPRSSVSPNFWFEFNGVPARRLVTSGRRPREVRSANRTVVKRALADRAQVRAWRAIHDSAPAPAGAPYSPPSISDTLKPSRPQARKAFAPTGFAPGAWFDWPDARDGALSQCQVSSAGPRPGYVWVVGHAANSTESVCWLGRLNHPYGYKGSRDGRQAISLDVLSNRSPDEPGHVLATCSAAALAAA